MINDLKQKVLFSGSCVNYKQTIEIKSTSYTDSFYILLFYFFVLFLQTVQGKKKLSPTSSSGERLHCFLDSHGLP